MGNIIFYAIRLVGRKCYVSEILKDRLGFQYTENIIDAFTYGTIEKASEALNIVKQHSGIAKHIICKAEIKIIDKLGDEKVYSIVDGVPFKVLSIVDVDLKGGK